MDSHIFFLTRLGGDAETWLMPGILVNVHKAGLGGDSNVGVIRDVLPVRPLYIYATKIFFGETFNWCCFIKDSCSSVVMIFWVIRMGPV